MKQPHFPLRPQRDVCLQECGQDAECMAIAQKGRGLARDCRGQSLVLAAVILFLLTIMSLMILTVGEGTTTQIRLQNAADMAAFAGAQVKADCAANIAWLNEAYADLYNQTVRVTGENAALQTMAELAEGNPDNDLGWGSTSYPAPDDVLGYSNSGAIQDAVEARATAAEWVPLAEAWMKRLGQLEQTIAIIAPTLIERQIFFTAKQNYSELADDDDNALRVQVYPGCEFVGNEATRHDMTLTKTGGFPDMSNWNINGWEFESETDSFNGSVEHQVYTDTEDQWFVELFEESGESTVESNVLVHVYYANGRTTPYPATYQITTNKGLDNEVVFSPIYMDENGNCHVWTENFDATINSDGTFVTSSGTYRWSSDGTLQKLENGTWTDAGGTVTVNGKKIQTEVKDYIEDGNVRVWLAYPPRITIKSEGNLYLRLSETPTIRYDPADFPGHGLRIDSDQHGDINGLRTDQDADGVWREYGWYSQWRSYRAKPRHRLSVLSEDTQWYYEWVRVGPYYENAAMLRFAMHGLLDPYGTSSDITGNPSDPDYWDIPSWENPDNDTVLSDDEKWEYYKEGRWTTVPSWLRPQRAMDATYSNGSTNPEYETVDTDRDYGGWYNISSGRPYSNTAYSQTRPCWVCQNLGTGANSLVNYVDTFFNQYGYNVPAGTSLPTPCGFYHITYSTASQRVNILNELQNAGATEDDDFYDIPSHNLVQVRCPLGCRHAFNEQPRVYDVNIYDSTHTSWPVTRVRRTLADARRRYDDPDYFEFSVSVLPLQMTTTGEFFRDSITVSLFVPFEDSWVNNLVGTSSDSSSRRLGFYNSMQENDEASVPSIYGYFAMASARVYMRDPDSSSNMIENFSWDGDKEALGLDLENDLDVLDRQKNWNRQKWLLSSRNNFEPDMIAAMTPLSKAIDVRDYYTEDELNDEESTDSNLELLMRLKRYYYWLRHPWDATATDRHSDQSARNAWNSMSAPPMQNAGNSAIDFEEKGIDEVIRH